MFEKRFSILLHPDPEEVVRSPEVDLGVDLRTPETFQERIDQRKRVLVLPDYRVDLPIVYTKSKLAVLLLLEHAGPPIGDCEGRINPLANISSM